MMQQNHQVSKQELFNILLLGPAETKLGSYLCQQCILSGLACRTGPRSYHLQVKNSINQCLRMKML